MADNNSDAKSSAGNAGLASLAQQIKDRQKTKGLERTTSGTAAPQRPATTSRVINSQLPPAPKPQRMGAKLIAAAPAKAVLGSTAKAALPPGRQPAPSPVARAVAAGIKPAGAAAPASPKAAVAQVQLKKMAVAAPPPPHPEPAAEEIVHEALETAPPQETPPPNPASSMSAEQLFAMAKMGYTQWEYGKLDRARAIFQTLVTQRPNEAWFRCALGSIFQRQRQFAQALQQYNIALQLDANDLASRVNRGEILLKVGKQSEGMADLLAAVRADRTGKNPSALRAKSLLTAMRKQLP